ncbi:hypothetical protein CVD28_03545 [Bacillus sp. M6-12]|uniref:hypothetical protein n=1 Tax=Bacillus sp. M6-12 TaxID=2054166 RepID=UPI000C75AA47|nr:hypothetical protein [Bacillus sp. M6-12]PLS19503.1 hypothetical protein CVD28_03545 [Bacillus sp. M6-12]
MYFDDITEENGQYIVKDSTSGGYVDRMTHSLEQNWTTIWDRELNLVSLTLGYHDLTEALANKDKEHYDYHRAVRTRSRHLKMLKDHLGIEYKKPKKQEKKEEPLIFLQKGYYHRLDKLDIHHAIVHDKTVDDGLTRFKKYDIHFARVTPKKEQLMKEYNDKLEEFKKYQNEMFEKIFEKE